MEFYDGDEFSRYMDAAPTLGTDALVIALLGGDACLRAGEILALAWDDIDHRKGQLRIDESSSHGMVTAPKSGKFRYIPLTRRLGDALRAHRHLRGARVLCQRDGSPWTWKMVFDLARRISRRAGLSKHGVHILRHSFGSALAMRGAPARAIQELMGHADVQTTQRRMHLSPASVNAAIQLLENANFRGDTLEMGKGAEGKS
jgi:integrase